MNVYDARAGRTSGEQLPGLFPFWLSRYSSTPALQSPQHYEAMERLKRDLLAYYERQARRLLHIASHCTDPEVQREIIAIASEYIETLEHAPDEKPIQRPRTGVALIVQPRLPPKARAPLTKIPERKKGEAA